LATIGRICVRGFPGAGTPARALGEAAGTVGVTFRRRPPSLLDVDAPPVDLEKNPQSHGRALRDGIFAGLETVGLVLVGLAVLLGVLNIVLLTSAGQELVDRLRPPGVGRYQYVYGGLGTLLAKLSPLLAVVCSLSAVRRGRVARAASAGRGMSVRAKLVVAALVFAAASWGVSLYRMQQQRADDDHDYQAARQIFDRLQADAAKLGEALRLEEAAVDFPRLLDKKSLVSKSDIEGGRLRLEAFVQAVKRFEADVTALEERVRGDITALAIADERKRQTLAAFDEKAATDRSQLKVLVAAELELGVAAGEILSFAESRSGTIRVDRDALQIKSRADVREYQRLVGRFQSAVERREKTLKEMLEPTRGPAASRS
jgi:hypothetical protein